ncbi:hypothetical protein V2J09_004966 [Rumex salicifolius]
MVVSGDREPKFFFKIVLPPILEDKRLRIPVKFVKEFRNDISSSATLIVPGEKRWTVRVLSEGGELWFSDGLDEFFEFYSVSFGFFLLFEYRGNSEFRVRIFNLTTCEISYPSIDASRKLSPGKTDLSQSRSEQTLNDVKEEVKCTPNHDNDDEANSYDDDDESDLNYASDDDDDVVVIERPKSVSKRVNVVLLSSDDEDESSSMNKKNDFTRARSKVGDDAANVKNRNLSTHKPKNLSFRAVMKSYNIEAEPMSLNIPAHIGRKFPRGVSGLVKLEVADGRSWIVEGNFLGGRLRSLGNGWSEFVHQMKLRIDDTCAFELISNDKEFSMKVSMRRNKPSTRRTY